MAEISIRFQDSEGNTLSNKSVYVNGEHFVTDHNGNVHYEAELGKKARFNANGSINGNRYQVKQINNMTDDTVVNDNSIQVEKDLDLVVIVG